MPAKIAPELRDQLLAAACAAPSSLNLQPYRIYYIDTPPVRAEVARLCMGQAAATTASALVVVVADIGSWKATHRARVARMRELGVDPDRIGRHERKMKVFGPLLFRPGWLSLLGYFKNAVFRLVNLWKVMGIPAGTRAQLFAWAARNSTLACQNLMIAAEACGLASCPMEGFDGIRLARFLGLSQRTQRVVLVVALGKRSETFKLEPQWRRPLADTVTYL